MWKQNETSPTSWRPRASRDSRPPKEGVMSRNISLARALLLLTFSTGLVDAVSYLGLGRVFTANMTGNIVLLGFGIAGSGGLPVVAPLVSLAAFLGGSAAGGVLAARTGDRRAGHVARALWIEFGVGAGHRDRGGAPRRAAEHRVRRRGHRAARAGHGCAQRHRPAAGRSRPDHHRADDDADRPRRRLPGRGRLGGGFRAQGRCRRGDAAGAVAGALLLRISLVPPLLAAAALALLVVLAFVPSWRALPKAGDAHREFSPDVTRGPV